MKTVSIIEYFAGNIFSVQKAFERLDCRVRVVSKPEELLKGDYAVLPGVGAFGDGMKRLQDQHIVDAIHEIVRRGTPLIGICLGMQLLFTQSEEFGHHTGLNLVPGCVAKLPKQDGVPLPNIGWSSLYTPHSDGNQEWDRSILRGFVPGGDVYFVHSFAAVPDHKGHWLAQTAYGNHCFCSAIVSENIVGCQFHPEKSGEHGIVMLRHFLDM